MLDALAELKKYRKINLDEETAFPGWDETGSGDLMSGIARDLHRIAKTQFKQEQQMEDYFGEMLDILQEKLDLVKTYEQALAGRDDLIKEMTRSAGENEKRTESLVLGLIRVSDLMEMIFSVILSSGNEDWIRQMERVKNAFTLVLAQTQLGEIGWEKYFNDKLHDAVALVEDPDRDFREVAGVEQKGYAYRGTILRKAGVVVNNYRKDPQENG